MYNYGLMVSTPGRNNNSPSSFLRRAERTIFDIVNFCYKLIMGKTEGLFAVLVV